MQYSDPSSCLFRVVNHALEVYTFTGVFARGAESVQAWRNCLVRAIKIRLSLSDCGAFTTKRPSAE